MNNLRSQMKVFNDVGCGSDDPQYVAVKSRRLKAITKRIRKELGIAYDPIRVPENKILPLTVRRILFDGLVDGSVNVICRKMGLCSKWEIWDRRHKLTHARISKLNAGEEMFFEIAKIDQGPGEVAYKKKSVTFDNCYRIHLGKEIK